MISVRNSAFLLKMHFKHGFVYHCSQQNGVEIPMSELTYPK